MFRFLTDSRAHTRRARRPAVSQLEALENRTCLSAASFTAIYTQGTGLLTVAEVAGSGSKVTISENAAGTMITVAGGPGTAINGGAAANFILAQTPINNISVTYFNNVPGPAFGSSTSTNNANDTLMVEGVSLRNAKLNVTLPYKVEALEKSGLGNNTVDISNDQFLAVGVADARATCTCLCLLLAPPRTTSPSTMSPAMSMWRRATVLLTASTS